MHDCVCMCGYLCMWVGGCRGKGECGSLESIKDFQSLLCAGYYGADISSGS